LARASITAEPILQKRPYKAPLLLIDKGVSAYEVALNANNKKYSLVHGDLLQ
jgi:hypothetical protein